MVVKFFRNKQGGSSKILDYLLNHREDEGSAKVLAGDKQLTRSIINTINRKQKVTAGALVFQETNLGEEKKYAIMQSFEEALLPQFQGRYNILWVGHTDKENLELNFVIPKTDLETNKALNPYYHKADLPRIENWQDVTNLENNFTNPKDPSKGRTRDTHQMNFLNADIKSYNTPTKTNNQKSSLIQNRLK